MNSKDSAERHFSRRLTAAVQGLHLPSEEELLRGMNFFRNDLDEDIREYASDLSAVIEAGRPTLWVHGHTHDSCDYMVGDTRVVCNPRGYDDENASFDSMLVVQV